MINPEVVFDINAITIPVKLWGLWFLLEVYKPQPDLTRVLDVSVKITTTQPGFMANVALFGYGFGLSLFK